MPSTHQRIGSLRRALSLAALVVAIAAVAHGQTAPVDLWTSGEGGYATYRIPSLIRTGAGALLAFCEGRKGGAGDTGNIDLLMRRSTDGGLTWHGQTHDPALIEPICQASVRRLRWPGAGQEGVILFSNPASRDARERMTVRVSRDDARTWAHATLVEEGFSAYSCLEALDDDTAGLLYEGAVGDKSYGRITFVRYDLDQLTGAE
jgi:hypothetical protein